MSEEIFGNAIQCTHCGDVIESKSRHDFVRCSCGRVFVDGGKSYRRIGFTESEQDYVDLQGLPRSMVDTGG
ncbi:MAG: hypothetical protein ACI4P0_02240 [Mailhella sp.]